MSDLRTQGDPIAIPYDSVTSALEFLGVFDHDTVVQVIIRPKRIIVERFRLDENGKHVAAGDKAATTTNIIAIRRDEP